jgi:pimeloyl-ACP methyl ester carboxylesterase
MGPATDGVLHLATGIATGYTEYGDPDGRPAVLLLHSWAASRREFARLLPLLPDVQRSVAVDLRGHGDADQPDDGYDVAGLAADVVSAMDALHMPEAVLVGASSGGYVAQQVAVQYPRRVAGLVLAGSPYDLRARPPFADAVDGLQDPVAPGWARGFLAGLTDLDALPGWYVDLAVADAVRIPAAVWRASLAGLRAGPPPTDAGTVRAPTLVVSGARDLLLADQAAALVARIPGARWLRYEDAGHLVLVERPERLAADVTDFLHDLTPDPSRGSPRARER